MYTIKEKLIALVLAATLPLAAILGGIGLYNISTLETMRAAETMNYIVEESTVKLDKIFIRAEDVVHHVASAVQNNVSNPHFIKDQKFRQKLKSYLHDLFNDGASSIGQIATYYVYFNPNITEQNDGFWYIKNPHKTTYTSHELTNVLEYGQNVGRTAWFYEPLKADKSVWLPPYLNENIDLRMISYSMPVKVKGELVAIVGIDIDFSFLADVVKEIKFLKTGYGFLSAELGKDVLYVHPEYPEGTIKSENTIILDNNGQLVKKRSSEGKLISYRYEGQSREMAFNTLRNGMKMVVTAPQAETYMTRSRAIFYTLLAVVLFTGLIFIVVVFFAKRISDPINDLKEASKKLSEGNYDFSIEKKSNDELGELTDSLNETIARMRNYVSTIKKMAFTDELTGVKNQSAYDEKTEKLNEEIKNKTAEFAVVMVDLNNLKNINDTFGHEKGNLAIIKTCKTICSIFNHSPVYRIGGDEFVVILENESLKNKDTLMQELNQKIEIPGQHSTEPWESVYIAVGCAEYHSYEDDSYLSVFRRADEHMYLCKKRQKGII